MAKKDTETRLSMAVRDGVLILRLHIRVRLLLALLAAGAALSGSPALVSALARMLA